jgi:four helix bundle protein
MRLLSCNSGNERRRRERYTGNGTAGTRGWAYGGIVVVEGFSVDNELRDFKGLDVWRVAMHIAALTYRETTGLPDDERFGLVSPMRRSAISMSSNIAEGYGRGSRQEYIRFLQIARGSACELETQVLLCQDLGYPIDAEHILNQLKGWYQLMHRLTHSL